MALTFLYAVDNGAKSIAIKFESATPKTSQFRVTLLTIPDVPPIMMVLQNGQWSFVQELPYEAKALEQDLLEAAQKFQR